MNASFWCVEFRLKILLKILFFNFYFFNCEEKPKLENQWLEPISNLQAVTYTKYSHKMGIVLHILTK